MNIAEMIQNSLQNLPKIQGPIKITEDSHPFCSMAYSREPLDLREFGYLEEEYFLSGYANIYDADEQDHLVLWKKSLPYKNRILVRRPSSKENFSGRVYVDILNATQGYDIEDLWHRNYLWCMENGHAYVGITSKPVNVQSLKNFDYDRYKDLNWSNGELTAAPVLSKSATIPGTEEGLIWDMLGQLGVLLRQDTANNCMGGFPVEYLYLTGQSQSGAYLNTYIYYFDKYLALDNGKKIFDGYMNIVGALVQRTVRQEDRIGDLRLYPRKTINCSTPCICISSEADLYLFKMFVKEDLLKKTVENADAPANKIRYYEIPATPHTDIICPVLTGLEEIQRTGSRLPNLDPILLENLNDIPMEYYICGLLEKLHLWASQGIAPETADPLARSETDLIRDVYGHPLGGLRTPYVDVPIASYTACNPKDPEGICGTMIYFTEEKVIELYGSREGYLRQFKQYVERQVEQGWISVTDSKKMIAWSEKTIERT